MMDSWRTFESLSQLRKFDYIHKKGRILACRHTRLSTIFLFYVPNFFVEISISKKKARCEYIRAFDATLQLEPFLDEINLKLDL